MMSSLTLTSDCPDCRQGAGRQLQGYARQRERDWTLGGGVRCDSTANGRFTGKRAEEGVGQKVSSGQRHVLAANVLSALLTQL